MNYFWNYYVKFEENEIEIIGDFKGSYEMC